MIFLNEYEVDSFLLRFDPVEQPNLAYCSRVLAALMEWTDGNSDGWAYWQKPLKASARLSALLHDHRYAEDGVDVTDVEVKRALTPIKAFLTRQGENWQVILPRKERT